MARAEFLSFSPPSITEAEIDAVVSVLKQGTWLSSGPVTKRFEETFRDIVGADSALALNSCTAGLHLAMVVHGVKEGDEVITSPLTFCATANVVEHVGGAIRFADVDPETLLIDPAEIERQLTKRTKVLLPVHYAGQPCDMPVINSLAKEHGLRVVEDCAHCMPSKIEDQWIGSGDNLCVFSFYATKNLTTGEGGMITGPSGLIDDCRRLALHGMTRNAWDRFAKGGSWKYDVPEPGFKYNLPDIPSALGLAQLNRLNELYARRMRIVEMYDQAFARSEFLRPLRVRPGVQSSHHLYVVLLNPALLTIDRDRFINELADRNIGTSVHYAPVHTMSYYAKKYGFKPGDFPVAMSAFERMLSLPLSSKMEPSDAADVIEAVSDVCKLYSR